MKKIYHLASCNTCARILKELSPLEGVELREIKTTPLKEHELLELHQMAGSYEALFSKRARLYKERNLKDKLLGEEDFKILILEHYTFLKRPVVLVDGEIFIGNSKKTVQAAREKLHP